MVKSKINSLRLKINPYYIIGGILITLFLIYIGFRMEHSEKRLIPFSVGAIMLGLLFESWRINKNKHEVLGSFLVSFVISFVAFFPGKHERNYNFESHVTAWPYMLMVIFIILNIAILKEKIIPKLTEGITLLQSISIIYWVIDYHFITDSSNIFLDILACIGLLFSLFSIINSLTDSRR